MARICRLIDDWWTYVSFESVHVVRTRQLTYSVGQSRRPAHESVPNLRAPRSSAFIPQMSSLTREILNYSNYCLARHQSTTNQSNDLTLNKWSKWTRCLGVRHVSIIEMSSLLTDELTRHEVTKFACQSSLTDGPVKWWNSIGTSSLFPRNLLCRDSVSWMFQVSMGEQWRVPH